jgi:hypothetical protein
MLRILVITAMTFMIARVPLAQLLAPAAIPTRAAADPGERELKALAAAWPDVIAEVQQKDGEWELRIDQSWFAWAHGRLLPPADAGRWADFAPVPFYTYPLSLPPLPHFDPETAAGLRKRVADEEIHPPRRSEAFMGTLLRAHNRGETESRLVRMEVAGFTLSVHETLKDPLERVSEELSSLRKTNRDVAAFLRGTAEMNGYNYRYVEGTRSRSLHSYGVAVDIIPKTYAGKDTYWLWAMNRVPDWWTVPYARRWMPPAAVIAAFEKQGFVWGGKWLFFDTMHFEYRPEILLLAHAESTPPAVAEMPES